MYRCLSHTPEPLNLKLKKKTTRPSLAVQWLRLHVPKRGVWVQSLLGALRSHLLHGVAKKKKKKKERNFHKSTNVRAEPSYT